MASRLRFPKIYEAKIVGQRASTFSPIMRLTSASERVSKAPPMTGIARDSDIDRATSRPIVQRADVNARRDETSAEGTDE